MLQLGLNLVHVGFGVVKYLSNIIHVLKFSVFSQVIFVLKVLGSWDPHTILREQF